MTYKNKTKVMYFTKSVSMMKCDINKVVRCAQSINKRKHEPFESIGRHEGNILMLFKL